MESIKLEKENIDVNTAETVEDELELTEAEKLLSEKAKELAREKELTELKNKSEKLLIITTIFVVGLIILSIILNGVVKEPVIHLLNTAEVVLLMINLLVFVSAGFNYIDSSDSLKAIGTKRNKGTVR